MSDSSKSGALPPEGPNQYSRNLTVGARDRGLGRLDYAVIQDGQPVAVMEPTRRNPDGTLVFLPDLANAQLFAAAPELYEACKSALETFVNSGVDTLFTEQILQLRQALAKADGSDADASEDPDAAAGEADTDSLE